MTQTTHDPVEIPDCLTSAGTKLVYLYLATHGSATLTDLHTDLNMQRLTLYQLLDTLQTHDLITTPTPDTYALTRPRTQSLQPTTDTEAQPPAPTPND